MGDRIKIQSQSTEAPHYHTSVSVRFCTFLSVWRSSAMPPEALPPSKGPHVKKTRRGKPSYSSQTQ